MITDELECLAGRGPYRDPAVVVDRALADATRPRARLAGVRTLAFVAVSVMLVAGLVASLIWLDRTSDRRHAGPPSTLTAASTVPLSSISEGDEVVPTEVPQRWVLEPSEFSDEGVRRAFSDPGSGAQGAILAAFGGGDDRDLTGEPIELGGVDWTVESVDGGVRYWAVFDRAFVYVTARGFDRAELERFIASLRALTTRSVPTAPVSPPPATIQLEPLPRPGDPDFTSVTAVDAADAADPCPTGTSTDPAARPSVSLEESSRLEAMLGVVLEYGSQHPDTFGGYGLHWVADGDASVFALFTADLATHRAALTEQVPYPDELIMCQSPINNTQRRNIQATLTAELADHFASIGSDSMSGRVTVGLAPTDEAIAADLVDRYGAAVDVTVGALTYPLTNAENVCGPPLEPSLVAGLEITVIQPDTGTAPTATGTAKLTARLTNTGDRTIQFGSGSPTAVITNADGTPRTIGTRMTATLGLQITLQPGAHRDFDLDLSLSSCDPGVGYLVPARDTHVVVSLYNNQLQAVMHSAPIFVTID